MQDTREQTLCERIGTEVLVHHSDRGSQYLSIRYAEWLAEAEIMPSSGSAGDSYDNASAETIIDFYTIEVIRKRASWLDMDELTQISSQIALFK